MKKHTFRAMFYMALGILLVSFALSIAVLNDHYSDISRAELRGQLELIAEGIKLDGETYLKNLDIEDTRITWVAADGTVLYDSAKDASQMENHADREEIREALQSQSGYGESRRYSKTMMSRYLYCAERIDDGSVVRVSRATNTILAMTITMIQPMCIVFLAAIVLAAVLSNWLSKRIVEPINNLNLKEPLSNEEYDELAPLLRRMDKQQRQLREQKSELNQRQEELNTIIDNMYEGLVLLGNRGNIVSINNAALRILGADPDCVGRNILAINRSVDVQMSVSDALDGIESDKTAEIGGAVYQITASPVRFDDKVRGAALMLIDVTEKEKSEQVRREFSANVSHELRTPLHSISGYAELLKNGMVRGEDVKPFATKIYNEAQRMIRLVEDIINLSHLDEGAADMEWAETDLSEIASHTVDSLQETAAAKNVKISFSGNSAKVYGIAHLMQEIVYNLCDNAIKYNKDGGTVDVTVREKKEKVVLIVKDTGIGIPEDQQERIFERFYRVDKSHSKEVGGTGLGLSIVKHAAIVHGAKIDLKSQLGDGTTIKISFPKRRPKKEEVES
jgi:two-component system phosphate regulon sensor histidine kinase PhoR